MLFPPDCGLECAGEAPVWQGCSPGWAGCLLWGQLVAMCCSRSGQGSASISIAAYALSLNDSAVPLVQKRIA